MDAYILRTASSPAAASACAPSYLGTSKAAEPATRDTAPPSSSVAMNGAKSDSSRSAEMNASS